MLGCAPGTAGAHSIRLGGPVTVMSRSRASTAVGEGRSLTAGGGRPLAAAAATSRADTGPATPAGRASCRGASSGFARASACLSLPVSLGNSGNAIAARLKPLPENICESLSPVPPDATRSGQRRASALADAPKPGVRTTLSAKPLLAMASRCLKRARDFSPRIPS